MMKEKMIKIERKYDLQKRFIDYAVRIINVSEQIPETKLSPLLQGSDKLISILFKSIDTAKKKFGAIATNIFGYSIFRVGYWIFIRL